MGKGFPKFKKPNIIILMTDQERATQHFPDKWVQENLPNLNYLKNHGITFKNAQISSCACSPSRATIWTGLYPSTTGVLRVGDDLMNTPVNKRHILGSVLSRAGYRVVFKGKWHLTETFAEVSSGVIRTQPLTSEQEKALQQEADEMLADWKFQGWLAPDGAGAGGQSMETLGGSNANNDGRFVQGPSLLSTQQTAIEFLSENQNPDPEQPFCLIISLVNPHDIEAYPDDFEEGLTTYPSAFKNYQGFTLPENYHDDLTTKPWAQTSWLNKKGKLSDAEALNFVKFYAYLHTLVDAHFGYVLNSISDALWDNTIVVRLADHGELGTCHGGLRDKQNTAYREVLNVPLIFSNPKWIDKGIETDALVELVDLVPTLAAIAGLTENEIKQYQFQGSDFSQTLIDPDSPAKDSLLFSYGNGADGKSAPPGNMNAIRCLRTDEWKYAVYYSSDNNEGQLINSDQFQYELYSVKDDPLELNNLLPVNGNPSGDAKATQKQLHAQLTQRLKETKTLPLRWPAEPV